MKHTPPFSPLILQTLIWIPTRLVLGFFIDFEVRGLEHVNGLTSMPQGHGVIFASNHSSELDPILLPAALPFLSGAMPIFYTSRPKNFYVKSGFRQFFYGGWLFKMWGAYPAYSGMRDYEKSLAHHIELLRAGKSVMIFPEGKISRDGQIGPAHGGVAFLAKRTSALIIPVGISGAYGMTAWEFFLRRRKVVLTFGVPIGIEKILNMNTAESASADHAEDHAENGAAAYKEAAGLIMDQVRKLL